MRSFTLLTLGVITLSAVSLACSKPEPPVLTPKEARVTSVTLGGIHFQLRVEAFNPNRVDLSARKVTGRVTLDGTYELGTLDIAQTVTLPAGTRTIIDVPLATTWRDLGALGGIAGKNRPIPYVINGVETIGGEHLNIDLPFHIEGVITHEQLMQATVQSLPQIPGIPIPGMLPR